MRGRLPRELGLRTDPTLISPVREAGKGFVKRKRTGTRALPIENFGARESDVSHVDGEFREGFGLDASRQTYGLRSAFGRGSGHILGSLDSSNSSGLAFRQKTWISSVRRFFLRRRVLALVNMLVFTLLLYNTILMVKTVLKGGDEISQVLRDVPIEDLPYPLNLAVRARSGNLTHDPSESRRSLDGIELRLQQQASGYSHVRRGTFRGRYPSESLEKTFDDILVISNPRCDRAWKYFERLASKERLKVTRFPMTDWGRVSIQNPPIPIADGVWHSDNEANKSSVTFVRRQVAYMDAHRRVWEYIRDNRKERLLVVDDSVFPTNRFRRMISQAMDNIDVQSVAMQREWHFIYLRRLLLPEQGMTTKEMIWAPNAKYHHSITVAKPSFGIGAYIVSLSGARLMLDTFRAYRVPLDVQIGIAVKEGALVALSACNNDRNRDWCPELFKVTVAEDRYECLWKRVWERRLSKDYGSVLR